MTGFGKSETKFQRKKLNAEIRSLNSKNIDLNLRIPNSYREIESKIRTKINGELSRGKIDLFLIIREKRPANPPASKPLEQVTLRALNSLE